MSPPGFLSSYMLIAIGFFIVVALFGLQKGGNTPDWSPRDRRVVISAASVVLIGWFLLALLLSANGAYAASADRMPTIEFGILTPLLVGLALISQSQMVARIIEATPQHWLVGI